jgi:hypothetical protein
MATRHTRKRDTVITVPLALLQQKLCFPNLSSEWLSSLSMTFFHFHFIRGMPAFHSSMADILSASEKGLTPFGVLAVHWDPCKKEPLL